MPKIAPPPGIVSIGADNTCSLATCPVEWSIYGYRPSLPFNTLFAALFTLIALAHVLQAARWRTWGFTTGVLLGCVTEIIGYVGRVLLWKNPFSFSAFMIQIVCLTIAPVFYTASIYVTLSKTITHISPSTSRFNPRLFYYIFLPADIICLVLQAAGGAMSSNSHGDNSAGVSISMAGLALQVAVLVIFIALYADYMLRYCLHARHAPPPSSSSSSHPQQYQPQHHHQGRPRTSHVNVYDHNTTPTTTHPLSRARSYASSNYDAPPPSHPQPLSHPQSPSHPPPFNNVSHPETRPLGTRFAVFIAGLSASTILILARCIYRVAELKDGYDGKLIAEEIPFIVLEGVVVALAAAALCLGHPGLVFDRPQRIDKGKGLSSDDEKDNRGGLPQYAPYSA